VVRRVSKERQEIAEELTHFVKVLNDESSSGALIVVEGQRDASALAAIGFIGITYLLCHNGSLTQLSEEAKNHRKVILLLDFDHKGRVLTKKAASLLEEKGIRIDLFHRRRLKMASKGRVQEVEELARYSDFLATSWPCR